MNEKKEKRKIIGGYVVKEPSFKKLFLIFILLILFFPFLIITMLLGILIK